MRSKFSRSIVTVVALLMSASAFAKGPWIHGVYRGEHPAEPERKFEIRFGMFNLPGTTARITSCNFCYTAPDPEALSAVNIINQKMETYLRDVVFTRMDYSPPDTWEVDYAYVESNGRVAPMATIVIPKPEPESITVKFKYSSLEFVMKRVSD